MKTCSSLSAMICLVTAFSSLPGLAQGEDADTLDTVIVHGRALELIGGMDQPGYPDAATLEKLGWAGIHHEGRAYAGQTELAYRPGAAGNTLEGTLE